MPRLSPRERVLKLLRAQGFVVEDISVTQGWYRTAQADCVRWTARVIAPPPARGVYGMFSWDTLTACMKGIKIKPPESSEYSPYRETEYEVFAKPKGK